MADDKLDVYKRQGLGLSICKSYVTAMGGTITCESAVDAGSVFSVELSFEKDLKQPSHTNESVEGGGVLFENMRALLCEDNGVNQVIARRILEKYGFEVEIASDGAEAVEKFLRSDSGHYDVIYMDTVSYTHLVMIQQYPKRKRFFCVGVQYILDR